jgi:hypothetical protein
MTGLADMGCIRFSRGVKRVTTIDTRQPYRYGPVRPSVRAHWDIFREDYARNRKDHAAANLAVLRKITLNLIQLKPAEKFEKQKFVLGRKRLYAL